MVQDKTPATYESISEELKNGNLESDKILEAIGYENPLEAQVTDAQTKYEALEAKHTSLQADFSALEKVQEGSIKLPERAKKIYADDIDRRVNDLKVKMPDYDFSSIVDSSDSYESKIASLAQIENIAKYVDTSNSKLKADFSGVQTNCDNNSLGIVEMIDQVKTEFPGSD